MLTSNFVVITRTLLGNFWTMTQRLSVPFPHNNLNLFKFIFKAIQWTQSINFSRNNRLNQVSFRKYNETKSVRVFFQQRLETCQVILGNYSGLVKIIFGDDLVQLLSYCGSHPSDGDIYWLQYDLVECTRRTTFLYYFSEAQ